ncbi:MAG: hypothetical protein AAGM40_27780 [Cyanobacteria bacterium J06573_2]
MIESEEERIDIFALPTWKIKSTAPEKFKVSPKKAKVKQDKVEEKGSLSTNSFSQ